MKHPFKKLSRKQYAHASLPVDPQKDQTLQELTDADLEQVTGGADAVYNPIGTHSGEWNGYCATDNWSCK